MYTHLGGREAELQGYALAGRAHVPALVEEGRQTGLEALPLLAHSVPCLATFPLCSAVRPLPCRVWAQLLPLLVQPERLQNLEAQGEVAALLDGHEAHGRPHPRLHHLPGRTPQPQAWVTGIPSNQGGAIEELLALG